MIFRRSKIDNIAVNINCLILWVSVCDILMPNQPLRIYISKMVLCVCVCVFNKRPIFMWLNLLNWATLIDAMI